VVENHHQHPHRSFTQLWKLCRWQNLMLFRKTGIFISLQPFQDGCTNIFYFKFLAWLDLLGVKSEMISASIIY
jgi:hypothetical protein